MVLLSLLGAILLAVVHLLAGKMRFLHVIPRSRWLSMAGGASVAYVFLHLLPELEEAQRVVAASIGEMFLFIEHHIYLLALVGLAVFYGLERLVISTPKEASEERPGEIRTNKKVFWIHIASFALYNLLIGYLLLHREETGVWNLVFFVVAMGLHFLVNDYGLNEHHEELYAHRGRWIITAAIFIGWGIGYLAELPEVYLSMLLAFLAGGVILNVLKEELPEERKSRFWAFALGATLYAALLLSL